MSGDGQFLHFNPVIHSPFYPRSLLMNMESCVTPSGATKARSFSSLRGISRPDRKPFELRPPVRFSVICGASFLIAIVYSGQY